MSWSPLETSTNGFMDDQTAKELSLREKKQLQWSKEKADQQEWFPFGKPGAGAPLKANRVRKNSSSSTTVSNNGGQSFHQQTNGVHIDHYASDQKTTISSISGSNGHHQSPKTVQIPYSSTPTNGNNNIPYGYVPSISTQPTYLPYYQAFPGAIAVPLHTNGFIGSPVVGPVNGHPAQMPPTQNYQNSNSFYTLPSGYSPQPVIIHQNHSFGTAHTNGLPQSTALEHSSYGTAGFQPAPQEVNGRGSMTASTLTEPSCHVTKGNSHDTSKSELSYTEQWASQLPVWQQMEHQQQQQQTTDCRPNTLPLVQQVYSCPVDGNTPVAVLPSTSVSVPVAPPMASSIVINNSPDPHHFALTLMSTPVQVQQPNINGQSSAPTAWVSPMNHAGVSNAQRTAIVSPLHSKAPSLCGNETADMMSSSFSGALPNKSSSFEDSGIHKRRHMVTDMKDIQELEEKQQKIVETKMAIEEQIAEKRRQQILEAEKERQEIERLDRERRLLELRENRENEHERNKWKELMEEEQRREISVRDALEKARLEAKINRKAKLLQHAWSGRRSDSEELDSPPYSQLVHTNGPNVAVVPVAALTIVSVNSGSSGSLVSAQQAQRPVRSPPPSSVVGSSLETSRSQSLPPVQHYANPGAVLDNRPIKPLTVDPLKLWEQIAKEQGAEIEEAQERVPRRDAPVRQSLRKSRSTEATRLAAARRSESLERKEKAQANDITTPKSTSSTIPKRVSKPKEMENNCRVELSAPLESRLASAATYIVRRDIFAPVDKLNAILNNSAIPPSDDKPPVPARRDKERKKSKSKDSSHKDVVELDGQDRQKLLQRRSSADRAILKNAEANGEPDNPWGDQLGGLNPLLQPISTRSRKKSQKLSVSSVPDSPVSATQLSNVSPKDISDSMSDLLISSSTDSVKGETKNSNEGLSTTKPNLSSGRSPNIGRFNFRSPLYSSFSVKIKQPNDGQSDVLKQLCKLKEQLKKSQKDVEDTLRLKTPFLTAGKNL